MRRPVPGEGVPQAGGVGQVGPDGYDATDVARTAPRQSEDLPAAVDEQTAQGVPGDAGGADDQGGVRGGGVPPSAVAAQRSGWSSQSRTRAMTVPAVKVVPMISGNMSGLFPEPAGQNSRVRQPSSPRVTPEPLRTMTVARGER